MSRWTMFPPGASSPSPARAARTDTRLLALTLTIACGLAVCPSLLAQGPTVQRSPLRPIASVAGKDLYHAYCEQCHGPQGKGDGPIASVLKTPPADLTQIAARNGGTYNRTATQSFIMGVRPWGRMVVDKASGQIVVMKGDVPDEMPPWEARFRKMWPDEPAQVRAGNLATYIETLQVK